MFIYADLLNFHPCWLYLVYKLHYRYLNMPPKKQEQDPSTAYKACIVLPIFAGDPNNALAALRKPVNIKKNIDSNKIIQLLKDKGLQEHIGEDGSISKPGRVFVGSNFKAVCEEAIAGNSKPVDPKKDAKKDAKKDPKKQEPVQQAEPSIEFQFDKNCSDFYFLLDYPSDAQQAQAVLQSQVKIDIVLFIEDQVKPGSRKPDFSLLNNHKSSQELSAILNNTTSLSHGREDQEAILKNTQRAIEMKQQLIRSRAKLPKDHPSKNFVIVSVPYQMNISQPEQNEQLFLNQLFKRICENTIEQQKYEAWKGEVKLVPMIEPEKQIIKEEVQVESNDKGKKGGKGEPVFETVERVVESRYEDKPENIRSDLKQYFHAKNAHSRTKPRANPEIDSIIRDTLSLCLVSLCPQPNAADNTKLQQIAERVRKNYEIRPLNKATTATLSENIREIVYPKEMSMSYQIKFSFSPVENDVSLMELLHKCETDPESLRVEYYIKKMQDLISRECPKIKWDFSDRQYIQKFSASRMRSILNEELMRDPQVFTGLLQTEGVKLVISTCMNPPGRVLHHNSIFEWKVLPDFQNWSSYFLNNERLGSLKQFLDYPCEEAGNLSIKSKSMMPTDNSIIRDEKWCIGSKMTNIIRFYKNESNFGLVNASIPGNTHPKDYIYWHQVNENFTLRMFKQAKVIPVEAHEDGESKAEEEGQIKDKENENTTGAKKVQKEVVCTWVQKKGSYLMKVSEGVEIFWSTEAQVERYRTFSQTGQITSFRKDGSIHIYDTNGDTSVCHNGRWTRIRANHYIQGDSQQPSKIDEIVEGETLIQIREDQTIFITLPNGDSKIIFPDGTEIYHNKKKNRRDIKSPFEEAPIIRVSLPKSNSFNLIGFGSAFAYLGFSNILERSYDGYMLEVIDKQWSISQYVERYEKNGKILEEQIRLISHQDSSLLKVNTETATIVYNSPNLEKVLTEEYLNERWLQAFTPPGHHQQMEAGIFDVDLNKGQIQTTDSESNKFIAKVDGKTEVNIAVSFVSADGDNRGEAAIENLNGFHVKEENYFLPPPNNSIPPRLFTIYPDGSGIEYLNSHQIYNLRDYSVNEDRFGSKTVRQYTKQIRYPDNYLHLTYTDAVDASKFGLPDPLKPPQTKQVLIPLRFCGLKHRVIEEIPWSEGFETVKSLEEKVRKSHELKHAKLSSIKS